MEDDSKKRAYARNLEELVRLPLDAYLNPEEVRIYARLKSRQAVYNWLTDKEEPLPATKKGGWRILKGDLDEYLAKRRNRRASDQQQLSIADQTLRKHLSQMVEISMAVINWKRACAVYRAASNPFVCGVGVPDIEWINQIFDDMNSKRDQLQQLTASLSEETLTGIRFMIPSIHSNLSLTSDAPQAEETHQPTVQSRR